MKSINLLVLVLIINACATKVTENINSQSNVRITNSFNHINHIRKEEQKKFRFQKKFDKDKTQPKYFVDYIIKNSLKKPEHKKYITDRKLLRKLKNVICWENYIFIRDSLSSGERCEIEIGLNNFDKKNHNITYDKETDFISKIDGKYPFGTNYHTSESDTKDLTNLKSLSVKINGIELDTKIENYDNLYNPNFCNFGMHIKIIEVYEDGENLYIYLFGGGAASSYFAKLIFDREKYITSIVVDYYPMSIYSSFGEHFIGF